MAITRLSRKRPCAAAAALALAPWLAGCLSPTAYGPSEGSGPGYREQRLEEDRYRVTFEGNEATSRETVESYLLYRAAELTLENGYDHFVVTERSTTVDVEYATRTVPLYGHYHHGRHLPHDHVGLGYGRFPYYAHGYPWSYSETRPTGREFEATAYVALREGEPPDDEPFAYDAREILGNLGPEVVRPSDGEGAAPPAE